LVRLPEAIAHCLQKAKQFGNYIVDFYCPDRKLVIELDGSQHYEPSAEEYDTDRDAYFESLGLRVLRFGNHDIDTQFGSVCQTIWRALGL